MLWKSSALQASGNISSSQLHQVFLIVFMPIDWLRADLYEVSSHIEYKMLTAVWNVGYIIRHDPDSSLICIKWSKSQQWGKTVIEAGEMHRL